MAVNKLFSGLSTFPPGGISSGFQVNMGLKVETYSRSLTYGQINGIKGMLKILKRLKVSKKLVDVAFNETQSAMGSPGVKSTYRVRIRYNE